MIKIAITENDLKKIFQLRYKVLREPWKQPYESAIDNLDGISVNVFIEENDLCIACGRLDDIGNNVAQIRYMAVHPDFRNKKLGQKILQYLENLAKKRNFKKIVLHARENALGFYLKNNYKLVRPSYLLFNAIQHYLMEKEI